MMTARLYHVEKSDLPGAAANGGCVLELEGLEAELARKVSLQLYRNDVVTYNVVMDNLRTHHIQAVSDLLHGAGAQVLYLPAYSPDLNPIEKLWSR